MEVRVLHLSWVACRTFCSKFYNRRIIWPCFGCHDASYEIQLNNNGDSSIIYQTKWQVIKYVSNLGKVLQKCGFQRNNIRKFRSVNTDKENTARKLVFRERTPKNQSLFVCTLVITWLNQNTNKEIPLWSLPCFITSPLYKLCKNQQCRSMPVLRYLKSL